MIFENCQDTDQPLTLQPIVTQTEFQTSGTLPHVIYFALDPSNKPVGLHPDYATSVYSDYTSFKASRVSATCFVIGTDNPEKVRDILGELRSDPAAQLHPVFLTHSFGQKIDTLCDGIVKTIRDAVDRAGSINTALCSVDQAVINDPGNALYRLLSYLYTRPETLIEPLRDWQHKQYYTYPLAQSFLDKSNDSLTLLQGLLNRKLIEPAFIIDRIRICPSCESAHLNYVDVCSNCKSINIQQKPFLHCFACGHVGPEETFLTKGYLGCPNCLAKLRHIGSDYDRPMENFQCNDCRHVFIEPEISVRCMQCCTTHSPETLVARNVYSFKITERGRTTAKTGNLEDVYAILDTLNNVGIFHFESFLDWFLKFCARHKEENFSLVGIRLVNIVELSDTLGKLRVTQLIDEFATRIRDLVRFTDITTRTSQRNLWILLPKTTEASCEIVLGRIRNLLTQTEQSNGIRLEVDMVKFCAPADAHPGETAKLLMARLEGALER